jgi:hypothetical protein
MANGTISLIAPDPGGWAFDLKITSSFPMITLSGRTLLMRDDALEDVSRYQHLSLPPDLRVHLSACRDDHLWLASVTGGDPPQLLAPALRALTYVTRPVGT